jgi:Ca-activated chloride channel family protein
MKLAPEDPKLTAYALDEIEDAREHAAIAAAVEQSPELQAAVQAIRALGADLKAELQAEPLPDISAHALARMRQAPQPVFVPTLLHNVLSWRLLALSGAAAAVLLMAVLLLPYGALHVSSTLSDDLAEHEIAMLPASPPPRDEISDPWPMAEARTQHVHELVAGPENKMPSGEDLIEHDTYTVTAGMLGAAKAINIQRQGDAPSQAISYDAFGVISDNSVAEALLRVPGVALTAPEAWSTEHYDMIVETGFRSPLVAPLSTFSIDVDTASYANVRRMLNSGMLPPANAVRIEELINYFPYADAAPTVAPDQGGEPFAVHLAQTVAPWNPTHRLLRVALKGYVMPWDARPASNLVFLLDVSGSMNTPNKLPLVKEAMQLLTRRLDGRDRVAIVVYAGASGLALPSTTANNVETIAHAIGNLSAGGSTNAGAGIQLAYKVARDHFIEGGNNRVILCTDGDFNVGVTDRGALVDIVAAQAAAGIPLTILGFGMGNYKDGMLEELSNKGKGSYAYIDSAAEARKVFLQDLASNLFTIARDVKIQVEFNPAQVQAYRLIGYENRRLLAEDFNNDQKQAGDIGPGHSIVALYEIIPGAIPYATDAVDALRYQEQPATAVLTDELATVKLRYKEPKAEASRLLTRTVRADAIAPFANAAADLRFTAAVAALGMRLAGSAHIGAFPFSEIENIVAGALGDDPGGHRAELIDLLRKAATLSATAAESR